MKNKWVLTDKSVRDYSQQVILKENIITIISKIGRKKVDEYKITLSEWESTYKNPTFNINYNKSIFIKNKTSHYDENCLVFRIRDSQIRAIDKVIELQKQDK